MNFYFVRGGSSINDVIILGVVVQGFCDDSTKALVIECVPMGKGVQNCPKLRDIIYGRYAQANL